MVVQESHRNSNSNHYQNMQISFIFVRMILLVLPLCVGDSTGASSVGW